MPINTFVIKAASRCNLNCSYCYIYNLGDSTYKAQPKFMSRETVDFFILKVRNYVKEYGLNSIFIVFHGGEPMLWPQQSFVYFVDSISKILPDVKVTKVIQTNGTLLDDDWCRLFRELEIQISISIDGPKEFHNEFRKYYNGSSSFGDVMKGFKVRNQYGEGGMIAVVNPQISPSDFYTLVKQTSSKVVTLLLPDENHDTNECTDSMYQLGGYAEWMISLYEIWKQDDSSRPRINMFSLIISNIIGGNPYDDQIGSGDCNAICIETDGSIEVIDTLRTCKNGFTKNSLNVEFNEINEIETEPLFELYKGSHNKYLPQVCKACKINSVCGGGYIIHRFSTANGFDNPSIYCKDLMKLIIHIQNDVIDMLPREVISREELIKISISECIPVNTQRSSLHENEFLRSFSNI